MKQVFIDICEKHLKYWHQLRDTSTMNIPPVAVVNELMQVFQQHNKSFEGICKWCPQSIAYLVRQVYQAYERDAPSPIKDSVLKSHVEVKGAPVATVKEGKPKKVVFLDEKTTGKRLIKQRGN
jgi:hypothetical protein